MSDTRSSKPYNGWLVYNWRKGKARTRKSKPSSSELGSYELLCELSIDAEIPEIDTPELAAKIDVPRPMVESAVLESIDGEALPEWADVADELVAEHIDTIESTGSHDDLESIVDRLTTRVLVQVDGYVDVEQVHDHLSEVVRRVASTEAGDPA